MLLCGRQDVLLPLKLQDSQDGIVGNGSIREELVESGPSTPLHQCLTFFLKTKTKKTSSLACGVFERVFLTGELLDHVALKAREHSS